MRNNRFSPCQKFLWVGKIVAFAAFCLLIFVLLVVFLRSKSFLKKKINKTKIVLITSFTTLLKCTPFNHPIGNYFLLILAPIFCTTFIYFYLYALIFICEKFSSVRIFFICQNLFSSVCTCFNL